MYVLIIYLFTSKILVDTAIDLEVPAHKASGFVTYVYPTPDGPAPRLIKVTIPIHGRYHEPSFDGKTYTSVDIDAPELLLRTEKCKWISFSIVSFHKVYATLCLDLNFCPPSRYTAQRLRATYCRRRPLYSRQFKHMFMG